MNTTEHLLTCAGEEATEIAQDVCKSLRFGLDDRNVLNPAGPTNRERLINELNDLEAVVEMLVAFNILPVDWRSEKKKAIKSMTLSFLVNYARKVGALQKEKRS